MSLSIWEYVRRRACEAMLAGFHDALDCLERQDQAQLIHAASKSLRKRLNEMAHNGGNGNGGNGNGNGGNGNGGHGPGAGGQQSNNSAGAAAPTLAAPTAANKPPQQPQNGPAPAPGPSPPTQHRKVGRPRKEVHG
jgi:ribonuclease E